MEILEGHVGHQQSQHLLGLVAHMGIAGVVGKGYVGGAVLGDVTGRVVLVVAVDGRAGDHAQDPATGLVAQDLGRQAVPQQLLVGPALCPQQAADIVHEPVIFRIAAHREVGHHQLPNAVHRSGLQAIFPAHQQHQGGEDLKGTALFVQAALDDGAYFAGCAATVQQGVGRPHGIAGAPVAHGLQHLPGAGVHLAAVF